MYQWTGDSSKEQKFKIVYDSATDSYKIYAMCSSNGTNRVLDVVRNGSPLASGQNIDIWTPVDHTAQRLRLTYLIDDLYHIHMLGNKDLYFTTRDKSNGTSGGTSATSAGNVYLSTYSVDLNHHWQFTPTSVSGQSALPTSPSNALSITGSTPYHAGAYTLSAGSAGYVKLTATQSYDCSVFTTGSTDTYIEIYSNAACTNLIAYDDEDGHSSNALIYFNVTAGNTYYIKVRGYSSITSGSYNFILHRGTPTSQSEKDDMFTTYNSSTYRLYNNCYTYALGYHVNPVTGAIFGERGTNPGEMANNSITLADLANVQTAKEAIEAALTADCEYFGGEWAQISRAAQPRAGYYKVALVLDPGNDYHWYRQLPNGQWAHKPGLTDARKVDCSNNIIYDPSSCDRSGTTYNDPNYTEFIGWYEIKTPMAAVTVAMSSIAPTKEDYSNHPKMSEIYTDLTISDINRLYVGMPFDKVIEILGAPHSFYGSGMIGNVYKLIDETEIIVYYSDGVISRIRTKT